jgi:hypothetical protein
MGQKAHQIAELMGESRARHADAAVARLAGEAVNRALIENYGDAAASRPAVEDGGGEEDSSALDFLKRLSHV